VMTIIWSLQELTERLSVSKRPAHMFDMERFNFKKLDAVM
jgi:hypothetical protein